MTANNRRQRTVPRAAVEPKRYDGQHDRLACCPANRQFVAVYRPGD
jgi:hypothetical protein